MSGQLPRKSVVFKLAEGEEKQDDTLFFGVELELEARIDSSPRQMAAVVRRADRDSAIVVSTDGSLYNGYEFITQPMTWKYLQTRFPWQMFNRLAPISAPFSASGRDTAGIHVHLSLAAFTDAHLARFLKFHFLNKDLHVRVAGRNSQWAQWNVPLGGPWTFNARRREYEQSGPELTTVGATLDNWATTRDSGGRYALGMTDSVTVELRYFRSTTNALRFRGYMEWVKAVYKFTKSDKRRDQSVEAFHRYLAYRSAMYCNAQAILADAPTHRGEVFARS